MWAVYYEDSVFTSTMGRPCDAPGYGVQCIDQPNETLVDGHWYLHRTDLDQWIPCHTLDGLVDQFVTYSPYIDATIVGRQTARATWKAAIQRMHGYR